MQTLDSEISASLEYIDAQQTELAKTLDHYESVIRDMYQNQPLENSGPDAEREYGYALAENCNRQLDEISQQVQEMIASVGTEKSTSEFEDIVAILNQHLSALQWIDANVGVLSDSLVDLEKQASLKRF